MKLKHAGIIAVVILLLLSLTDFFAIIAALITGKELKR